MPHHESVTSRAVHWLEDHRVESFQHEVPDVGVLQVVGRDVGENRLLAEVVLDDLGDVGVERLVVGDPVAHCVGQGHGAGPRCVEDSGYSQDAVRPEVNRIQVVVVDPTIDHVHLAGTLGCAHEDRALATEQVATLHQFHTHPAREKGMLEVGGVVNTRREHHHRRVGHAPRCRRQQRGQ